MAGGAHNKMLILLRVGTGIVQQWHIAWTMIDAGYCFDRVILIRVHLL